MRVTGRSFPGARDFFVSISFVSFSRVINGRPLHTKELMEAGLDPSFLPKKCTNVVHSSPRPRCLGSLDFFALPIFQFFTLNYEKAYFN